MRVTGLIFPDSKYPFSFLSEFENIFREQAGKYVEVTLLDVVALFLQEGLNRLLRMSDTDVGS